MWTLLAVALVVSLLTFVASQTGAPSTELTATQRTMILKLQSVLLHDTVSAQYFRVSLQPGGGGYVAGIGDFATADGSAAKVIDAYSGRVGDNVLSRDYRQILTRLAEEHSAATTQLGGYSDAWRQAGRDPVFRQVQDDVLQAEYLTPATTAARKAGVRSPLGIAIFFDAILQHGNSESPDGLPALVRRTNEAFDGPPDATPERDWLTTFLTVRGDTLLSPSEPRDKQLWPLSVVRVEALADLLERNEMQLEPPLVLKPYGTVHTLDADPPQIALPPLTPEPATTSAITSPNPTSAEPVRPSPSRPVGPVSTASPAGSLPRIEGAIVGIAGLCLDLHNAWAAPGTHVKTYTCNQTKAQRWLADSDGALKILGLCVQPLGGSGAAGTPIVVNTCDPATPSQQWRFSDGQIRNAASDSCLTVPGDSTQPDVQTVLAPCNHAPGQLWSTPV